MNRTKLLTIAVISLLLINIATLGFLIINKPRHDHNKIHPAQNEGPKQIIVDRLELDDAQQKQYQLLIDDHRKKTRELHEVSAGMHNKLYSLLKTEPVNRAEADSIIQEIANNQKAIDNLNFDHFQQIKKICRQDQLDEYNKLASDLSELFSPKGPPPGENK